MGINYIVAQGDYLSKIARTHGFASYLTIWDAPENKGLKDKRKNPNILFPGDELFIPDKETKEESCLTESRHKFELQGEKLMLRLAIKDLKNHPLQGNECTLTIETDSTDLVTKSDGTIQKEIPEPHKVSNGQLLDKGKAGDKIPIARRIPLNDRRP